MVLFYPRLLNHLNKNTFTIIYRRETGVDLEGRLVNNPLLIILVLVLTNPFFALYSTYVSLNTFYWFHSRLWDQSASGLHFSLQEGTLSLAWYPVCSATESSEDCRLLCITQRKVTNLPFKCRILGQQLVKKISSFMLDDCQKMTERRLYVWCLLIKLASMSFAMCDVFIDLFGPAVSNGAISLDELLCFTKLCTGNVKCKQQRLSRVHMRKANIWHWLEATIEARTRDLGSQSERSNHWTNKINYKTCKNKWNVQQGKMWRAFSSYQTIFLKPLTMQKTTVPRFSPTRWAFCKWILR